MLAVTGVLLMTTSAARPAEGQTSASVRTLPRAADGKPDLSGIWQALNTAAWNIQDHPAQKGIPGGQGVVEGNDIPYLPGALQKKQDNWTNRLTRDTESRCYQPGVPRVMYLPFPFQILQVPGYIGMAFEYIHGVRHIYMNSAHPKGPIEWWMGDSRGRWEGDTLVVDVVHFTGETWFDREGNHHSDALHLVERYTLLTPDHIEYDVTVEDPTVFSRPWKMRMPLYRRMEPGLQILDYECHSFDDFVRPRH